MTEQKRITWKNNIQGTIIVLCVLLLGFPAIAATLPEHKYPRNAAFFLKYSAFSEDEIQKLARFQIVILTIQNQVTNRAALVRLRQMNPSIVILGYTSAVEFPLYNLEKIEWREDMPWHIIQKGLSPEWFLKKANGEHMAFWPGTVLMNSGAKNAAGKTYAEYLSNFLTQDVLTTGLWDGLFFDTVWDGIFWNSPDADIDGDGIADGKEKTDRAWQDGQNLLFKTIRDRVGDRYLLVGNGVLEPYAQYLNGRMFEGFPDVNEGGWAGSVEKYQKVWHLGVLPTLAMINTDTQNTGNWQNWQRMRYGLATTLLLDGYYNFDWGLADRDQLWWYDEYDVSLGKPSSFSARNLLDGTLEKVARGLWRRDFQYGAVLVNSTNAEQTVRLDEEFEHIHGKQDPETNDGSITRRVTLAPESGILLMRPIDEIRGSPFTNGAFARVFNGKGEVTRTGFFAYETGQRGSAVIAHRDLYHDGNEELVIGDVNRIVIYKKNGELITKFFPYGEQVSFGIRFAFGDLDHDGRDEIVTAGAAGGGAEIAVYRADGTFVRRWRAFGSAFSGGASVAVGDLNGDGVPEIVVGAGYGREPQVRIFRPDGSVWNKGWLAYAKNFRGGVNVAVGDLDGDRRAEIITGAGRGGGPHVRIFSGTGAIVNSGFFAFTATKRDGVDVLAHDFDGDGKAEVVAMSTNVFTTASLFRP
ncbi:VCBS repeat-containing protein [Candidatus Uhrbacteria bacterium]|nr:VCBS repeat-containing protein [Candidatus Uhrbacteria bacterium]